MSAIDVRLCLLRCSQQAKVGAKRLYLNFMKVLLKKYDLLRIVTLVYVLLVIESCHFRVWLLEYCL